MPLSLSKSGPREASLLKAKTETNLERPLIGDVDYRLELNWCPSSHRVLGFLRKLCFMGIKRYILLCHYPSRSWRLIQLFLMLFNGFCNAGTRVGSAIMRVRWLNAIGSDPILELSIWAVLGHTGVIGRGSERVVRRIWSVRCTTGALAPRSTDHRYKLSIISAKREFLKNVEPRTTTQGISRS